MKKPYSVTLEATHGTILPRRDIVYISGDAETMPLSISLVIYSKPLVPKPGAIATLNFKAGTHEWKRSQTFQEDGTLLYDITPGDIAVSGDVALSVMVVTDDEILTWIGFSFLVLDNPAGNQTEAPEPIKPLVQELLTQVSEAKTGVSEVKAVAFADVQLEDRDMVFLNESGSVVRRIEDIGGAGKPGDKGDKGDDGKSAYEVAVDNGFVGTEAQWLESMRGKDGKDGYTPVKDVDYFDGSPGAAATIEIGDVVTVEPGEPARVENVGTPTAAVLNISIPKGEPGPPGQGAEAAVTAQPFSPDAPPEAAPAAVLYDADGNPILPVTSTDNVLGLAAALEDVPKGKDGEAATIEVDSTTTLEPDEPARVTNIGTPSIARLKFEIPRGLTGDVTGQSLYEHSIANGFEGTYDDWLREYLARQTGLDYVEGYYQNRSIAANTGTDLKPIIENESGGFYVSDNSLYFPKAGRYSITITSGRGSTTSASIWTSIYVNRPGMDRLAFFGYQGANTPLSPMCATVELPEGSSIIHNVYSVATQSTIHATKPCFFIYSLR